MANIWVEYIIRYNALYLHILFSYNQAESNHVCPKQIYIHDVSVEIRGLGELIWNLPVYYIKLHVSHLRRKSLFSSYSNRFFFFLIWIPRVLVVAGGMFSYCPWTFSEKAVAPHSRTLAWKIPWMEEPGGLQSMGSLRVRND